MRFACQSCGKAYNLPEERIADKSNVKLKCRVCGAIVEVKRQGELVANVLEEDADGKPMVRLSEAPAPLTSITPEDDDTDGATVSISEASINDQGPLELELPPMAATGFASAALGSTVASAGAAALPPPLTRSEGTAERLESTNVAPPLPPPPLSPSSLPPPPALRSPDSPAQAGIHASNGNGVNTSNGSSAFFSELASRDSAGRELDEGLTPELRAPVAPSPAGAAAASALGSHALPASALTPELADFPAASGEAAGKDPTFKFKMLAAFATGVLIDRIVSGLFQ
jgi:hypothetical protein